MFHPQSWSRSLAKSCGALDLPIAQVVVRLQVPVTDCHGLLTRGTMTAAHDMLHAAMRIRPTRTELHAHACTTTAVVATTELSSQKLEAGSKSPVKRPRIATSNRGVKQCMCGDKTFVVCMRACLRSSNRALSKPPRRLAGTSWHWRSGPCTPHSRAPPARRTQISKTRCADLRRRSRASTSRLTTTGHLHSLGATST